MKLLKNAGSIFSRYKLRTKMMLIYIIVIIPVFIGSMYLLHTIRVNMSEDEKTNVIENVDSIKIRIVDMVFIVENVSERISSSEEISGFISKDYENKSEIYNYYAQNNFISNYVSILPQLDAARIYLLRDDFAYNSVVRYADEETASHSWFKAACEDNKPVWRVITDPVTLKQNLSCISKLTDSDGNICGVSVLEINSEWINEYVCDRNYRTVLSLNNGIVYFSTLDGIKPGHVISATDTDISVPDNQQIFDTGLNGIPALTVLNTFYGSDRSNTVFQVFSLSPNTNFDDETEQITSIYSYYILLLFALSLTVIILFVLTFTKSINRLSEKMHSVALGNFNVKKELVGNDEISMLEDDLCVMVDSMQLMMNDVYNAKLESERLKLNQRDAEFKALASQINPHFLYNTLETIRMKAYCNNDKETADLIKKLGKFMRRCLEVKNNRVTLKSEIEFTNSYLELQAARFGDKIAYEIRSSVDDTYPILPLIIQPIVENAFVHGIESSKTNGRIDVHIYYCGVYVYIDVTDNGQGIPPEKIKQIDKKLTDMDTSDGKSIGLTNVNKRIKMSFGDIYGISVSSKENEGTKVRVMLPRHPDFNRKEDGTNA